MKVLQGNGITRGRASGEAIVTKTPMNLTAAHTKFFNLLRRGQVWDRHHELFRKQVNGKILVLPRCVGSTFTGIVLLELIYREASPLAIVVGQADSLLVSGSMLADVWLDHAIPVVEYGKPDLFDSIHTGDSVTVDAGTGEILVQAPEPESAYVPGGV